MKIMYTPERWPANLLAEVQADFPALTWVDGQTPARALAAIHDVEAVFGHLTREEFCAAHSLRWIQAQGAGVDWMAGIPELLAGDVIVTNARGAHGATIAEHTFCLLVCLARGFYSLFRAQERRHWLRPLERPAVGLSGLTMGIVGLGYIGRAIAQRALAYEMEVLAVDPFVAAPPAGVSACWDMAGLPELLRRSDAVVITAPLTTTTWHMIGAAELALMKPTAYLLHISRGGVVDEAALIEALTAGRLAGAGLDVQEQKPVPPESKLWDTPNLIITPHCSGESQQTFDMATGIFRDNLRRYLAGEPLLNLVDKQRGF